MKIKRLLILAVLPMMCLAANAQNCSKDNTPKKGDFTVAATVGYNSYTNVTAPSGLLTDYEVRALSTNWADKKLMVGFEGGWFFKDQWKLNLGGGVSFTNNPGYPAVPGTIDDSNKNNSADENMGEIPNSYADIIVCDAFVGNCILKLYEGEAKMILGKIKGVMMSSLKTKIGALLIKKSLKTQLKSMDASEHGGAPLIGLNGLVVKTHGNAKAKEVKNSLIQCVTFTKMNINDKIIEALGQIPEQHN